MDEDSSKKLTQVEKQADKINKQADLRISNPLIIKKKVCIVKDEELTLNSYSHMLMPSFCSPIYDSHWAIDTKEFMKIFLKVFMKNDKKGELKNYPEW